MPAILYKTNITNQLEFFGGQLDQLHKYFDERDASFYEYGILSILHG